MLHEKTSGKPRQWCTKDQAVSNAVSSLRKKSVALWKLHLFNLQIEAGCWLTVITFLHLFSGLKFLLLEQPEIYFKTNFVINLQIRKSGPLFDNKFLLCFLAFVSWCLARLLGIPRTEMRWSKFCHSFDEELKLLWIIIFLELELFWVQELSDI